MSGKFIQLSFLIAGLAVFSSDAAAQDVVPPGFGVGVGVGVITLSPEINQREWGGNVEGSLRYTWPSGIQVTGGANYGFVSVDQVSDDRTLWGIFADGRLVLQMNARSIAPYVGGRVAYINQSLDTQAGSDTPLEFRGDGWNFSGLFGILARLSDRLAFDAYLIFGVAPFGDIELNGETIAGSGGTDYTAGLKVGLVYSFGG